MAEIMDATPRRRQMMQPLIAYLKRRLPVERRKALVEIGSFCGHSTLEFASIFDKVYAVDAWDVSLYPKDSKDVIKKQGQQNLTDAEKAFDESTKGVENIVKLKMTSQEAFKRWPELFGEKPTAVYIDAQHEYPGAVWDVKHWSQVARILVMGHDFSRGLPGVMKAVNEVFGKPDLLFSDASWVHDIEMHLQPNAPMDAHELHHKLRIFAKAAEDEFRVGYRFDIQTGMWHVTVTETADNHDVFSGRGYTVEEANRCCWSDILLGHRDYGYKLAPIFVDEAEELRRAVE